MKPSLLFAYSLIVLGWFDYLVL